MNCDNIMRIRRIGVTVCMIAAMFSFFGICVAQTAARSFGISVPSVASPIGWQAESHMLSATEGVVTVTATLEDGWHLYGMKMPDGGPQPTQIRFEFPAGVEATGKLTVNRTAVRKYDDMFGAELEYWDGAKVTFTRHFKVKNSPDGKQLKCVVRFMGCNDETCLPPQTKTLTVKINQAK